MTIINGFKKPWKWLNHLCVNAYKWYDLPSCPDANKKFSKIGIRLEDDKWECWKSLYIVYWPKRYIVISWMYNDGGCEECE